MTAIYLKIFEIHIAIFFSFQILHFYSTACFLLKKRNHQVFLCLKKLMAINVKLDYFTKCYFLCKQILLVKYGTSESHVQMKFQLSVLR